MSGTVFIVDDDAAMRMALRQLMESAGLAVEVFADGRSFLEAAPEQRADCVVLDLAMPGMDGEEVHRRLREREPGVPVIFLTGHGSVPSAVEAVRNGAVDFLEKPVRGHELLERVREALASYEAHREAVQERARIRAGYGRLSPRECEVLALVVEGHSSKGIAQRLGLSHRTVEVHRTHVMHKMGAGNVAELVAMAGLCGLPSSDAAPSPADPASGTSRSEHT